ncbi:MAG: HNH endonuclease [Bacteroidota bacterium]
MQSYTLTHLSDAVLVRDLNALVNRHRESTAQLLAHLAEVDSRRLYVPAGYSSMFGYCVGELRFSEDAAYKRIQAARAARRFPALFQAVAEGRLHLTAVGLLAPHLSSENADELIEVATHRRKFEIEQWLARRFPAALAPARIFLPTLRPVPHVAPAQAGTASNADLFSSERLEVSRRPGLLAPAQSGREAGRDRTAQVDVFESAVSEAVASESLSRLNGPDSMAPPPQARVGHDNQVIPGVSESFRTGAGSESYLLQVLISSGTYGKLRHAQALLSHAVPARDVAQLLDRALDALIALAEKRKIGVGGPANGDQRRSRKRRSHTAPGVRHIPARVRREVWERDGGQCTFVSSAGHRCTERHFLEFDHVRPVARGGRATVEGIRLRCRAHNQYEAERAFGSGFIRRKRQEAKMAGIEANRTKNRRDLQSQQGLPWRVAHEEPATREQTTNVDSSGRPHPPAEPT